MTVMENIEQSKFRRSFTKEFKVDAVSMVLDEERSVADVVRSLDIGAQTLGNWVRQARVDSGDKAGVSMSEKTELARLRKENKNLRMERDLLKRATAFWVNESACPCRGPSEPLPVGHGSEGRRVPSC